ncbi:hypothetical protein C943_02914 [Mariniradius saccharolyticus AK6]|uniref:DUF4249 domain-containing protein n=1 Tax=Mariniradius saccharolyticus AK6 TaxID=1239962 RepID=M7Y2N5_9BACT|nr:DUF4249 family protein [Mariniradius saccharolyticus]EMS35022.1 hypothetical protein C943_02914 [Mariniradius saccharolyticus AK6]
MRRLLLPLIAIVSFSCQEEVFLPLENTEPIPVIEALWTDNPSINQVRVSYSKDYYDTASFEVEENAQVSIRNLRTGGQVNFRFNQETKKYVAERNISGTLGESYELSVKIGEKEYSSTGTILFPPLLDSIVYNFREERIFREEGYYLTVYGKIPFADDNNYRIRMVKNDTLLNSRFDYLLFDDTFGTNILDNGFELNGFPFKKNDKVRLELYRLNQDAFDYLNQLVGLLFNDGGLFSPPPQNPTSNIKVKSGGGQVLGYFMASPFLSETIIIDPGEAEEDE